MPLDRLRPSFTFTEDRLDQLRAVVPEAFADGKVNWDTLRESLGEYLEDESEPVEHFGLTWPGKRQARRAAATPSHGTLVPCPGEGVNEATTRNIFIEGDNLEVLKLLQKSYAGRIKMIYIDPPYNTGNDFIYVDDYAEPIESYLRRTGQMGEGGEMLTTNPKTSGRFHSNWLNMMYPRLLSARQLLGEFGVIFISIDVREEHHLRALMDEVFGSESLIGVFTWQSKKGGGSDTSGVVTDHEYVMCYGASSAVARKVTEADDLDRQDEKGPYRRGRELNKWGAGSRREDRPTMFFPVHGPNNEDVYPIRNDGSQGRWRLGKTKMFDLVNRGDAEFEMRADKSFVVYEKIRATDPRFNPYRTWLGSVGTTSDGSKTLKALFDGRSIYDFPKPVSLLLHLLAIGSESEDAIVLDFCAGSCTTAQAVLERNRSTEGTCRFIMVQLPEPTPATSLARADGFSTISSIGKDRIRRVIASMQREAKSQLDLSDRDVPEDLGFRAYRLTRSHFRRWRDYTGDSLAELQARFSEIESPLVDGWKPEDLVVEVMLQEGFPLDSTVEAWAGSGANAVQIVASDACEHRLWVCLDERVAEETVSGLALEGEDVFVCLDSAVTDEQKMRLADRFNVKVI